MNQFLESVSLACRDWKFEYLISICSVMALASMLSPLLVLLGLKNGVIDGMRSRLMEDPGVLVILPKSDAGKFSKEYIEELGKLPGARYAVGRTRDTSTDVRLFNPESDKRASIAFEPATPGEPLLEKYRAPVPVNGQTPDIVLSASAAKTLAARVGSDLVADLGRRSPSGKLESAKVTLKVTGVLPIDAGDRRAAFAPLAFMEEMENYRDYIEVRDRGWAGDKPEGDRKYSSFRLYAASLDAVEDLAANMEGRQIEVITQAKEIASIRALERAINQIILIISLAVGLGFAAFTVSSVQSAVVQKKRMLGMLRLLGFKRSSLLCYPLAQSFLTTTAGFIVSLGLYFFVAWGIAYSFVNQGLSCKIGPLELLECFAALLLLSFLACLRPAILAARVEPSVALREV